MAMTRLLALILIFMHTALLAQEVSCWRVGAVSPPKVMAYASFELHVLTAEMTGTQLTLRAALRNAIGEPAVLRLPIPQRLVKLRIAGGDRNVPCTSMKGAWTNPVPSEVQVYGGAPTELVFDLPPEWRHETLLLDVETHSPVRFTLEDRWAFKPSDLSRAEGQTVALDSALVPLNSENRDIGLRVGSMRCAGGLLTLELSFVNLARYPLRAENCPKGQDAALVTLEGENLRQMSVRGGIAGGADASGAPWQPDELVRGMVSFVMPHPHMAQRLWFSFPGYPNLPLLLDDQTGMWRLDEKNVRVPVVTQARLHSQMEQALFEEVRQFWAQVSKGLVAGDTREVEKLFELGKDSELFQNRGQIAFEDMEIAPFEDQELQLFSDELRMVSLRMKYRLKGQRDGAGFYLPMFCRMNRLADGSWRVKALTFPYEPPFWSRGFQRVARTEHFIVVHKDGAADAANSRQMAEHLERAYANLSAKGLPLNAAYVAFHCREEGDFQILSGADPEWAGGCAGGVPLEEKGRQRIYNLAMFVNAKVYTPYESAQGISAEKQVMLEHELAHLALGEWTRAWTPSWLVEGAAVYYSSEQLNEDRELRDHLARGGVGLLQLSELANPHEKRDFHRTLHLKYMLSAYAVAVIAKSQGEARLIELYRSFAEESPALWQVGKNEDDTSPAKRSARVQITQLLLKKHLGISVEELEAQVVRGLRK